MVSGSLTSVLQRRFRRLALFALGLLLVTYLLLYRSTQVGPWRRKWTIRSVFMPNPRVDWANRRLRYPIPATAAVPLHQLVPRHLPRVQHDFSQDAKDETRERVLAERRDSIREAVRKSWMSYRQHAWGYDELRPLSRSRADTYGGWGVTLVDSLDTLWILGLEDEFREAAQAVAFIDWNGSTGNSVSLFETNIRYLGGLLSAYDLSGEPILLSKALELGNMLYAAFDTPNHLPVNLLYFRQAKDGTLALETREAFAAVTTLSLEFTRLSQLTGDPKFYGVIDNIKYHLNRTQDKTRLPGLWPMYVNLKTGFDIDGTTFTLGGQADSGYEYLPKMYALLGGLDDTYGTMHKKAMDAARKHLLFRAMIPNVPGKSQPDVLFSGTTVITGKQRKTTDFIPRLQHLGCFTGGHFALGGKLFGLEDHVAIGERLARGCAWAYGATASGLMPEVSSLIPCPRTPDLAHCDWDEHRWEMIQKTEQHPRQKLPSGFHQIRDARYLLRPEAVESLFVLYRVTGKREMQELAWDMFVAMRKAAETESDAFASVDDVTVRQPQKLDSMESFWIAETLKYLYLIFSEPGVISLDDYVFNTEAHPFRIPKPSDGGLVTNTTSGKSPSVSR